MTDGAMEYRSSQVGVVEHHWVNHSARPRENARSVDMLLNVVTGARGAGVASTNLIDSEWGRVEEHIPRAISARTADNRVVMDEYIRAGQWRRMVSTGDRWEAFCKAAMDWILVQQEKAVCASRGVLMFDCSEDACFEEACSEEACGSPRAGLFRGGLLRSCLSRVWVWVWEGCSDYCTHSGCRIGASTPHGCRPSSVRGSRAGSFDGLSSDHT
jgi:hypothetical protein